MSVKSSQLLPDGVVSHPLRMNVDARGCLTEVYREEWRLGERMVQWNLVDSEPNVMRGVRVHFRRWDYIVVLRGEASIGVRDLRRASPTEGLAAVIWLEGTCLSVLTVPPGIAHGLYSHGPVLYLIGETTGNDGSDEQSCKWDAPGLGIDWPFDAPVIGPKDEGRLTVAELAGLAPPWRGR